MSFGKIIRDKRYIHTDGLYLVELSERIKINEAANIAAIEMGSDFNVVKIGDNNLVTLLSYPSFMEDAFPELSCYWSVDLSKGTYRYRSYSESLNPPILHRKELLLPEGHSKIPLFKQITEYAEQIGLFDKSRHIGFKNSWDHLLFSRGYKTVENTLVPIGNFETDGADYFFAFESISRHRTALSRANLSAPIQSLDRFGFLDGNKILFDYGCGRGDDVRWLVENGIVASGWDPYYAPEIPKRNAHIVNLGFVINVIEDRTERVAALKGAYELADEILVVSAMLSNPEVVRGKPFNDGVLTTRNTFQKYYTQEELRDWISAILERQPIAVGPGIFYIFKDTESEQRFQLRRQENRHSVLRYSAISRSKSPFSAKKAEQLYQDHAVVLEELWETRLRLARLPDREEVNNLDELTREFGTISSALRFIQSRKENAENVLKQAMYSRIEDLKVYFADEFFQKRKPYRNLESCLKRDVRAFFGDYQSALEAGRNLLLSAANSEVLNDACRKSAELGLGWLEDNRSLQLHTSLVPQLPSVLRVYINCGLRLYGDASSADLIKIHIQSGKLTLMNYEDFDSKPLPRLLQRVKINLRDQNLDIFEYEDEFDSPYLYRKSRFINEEHPNFAEQLAFDEALEKLHILHDRGYGPKSREFDEKIVSSRWTIKSFELIRSNTIPELDSRCGAYFTYRDLIECGETQSNTGLANLPKQADTYTAFFELARNLIDPIIDYFGMIKLTYGFSSSDLCKHIKKQNAPKLDQHAGHELNRLGKPICERLGAAIDFIVDDEDMLEVAKWISENIPFDRMYIYGKNRPIHISYSPTPERQIVLMLPSVRSSKLVPKIVNSNKLLTTVWTN